MWIGNYLAHRAWIHVGVFYFILNLGQFQANMQMSCQNPSITQINEVAKAGEM